MRTSLSWRIRRTTTYASYEGDVRLHIIPGIGKRKLKSLQPADVRAWLTGLQSLCQCCAQGKDAKRASMGKGALPRAAAGEVLQRRPVVEGSIQHILRVLRAALQDAVDEELLNRNVARLVQLRVTDKRNVRAFTVRRPFASSRRHRVIGCMPSGRLRCRWACGGERPWIGMEDVDLDSGLIKIHRALHRVDSQLHEDVKTEGSAGLLPLPPPLVKILKAIAYAKRRSAWRQARPGETPVCVHHGDWRTHRAARSEPHVQQPVQEADVPRIRVHDLRHSCATLLFTMGVRQPPSENPSP